MLKSFHGNEFLKNLQSSNYFSCDCDHILDNIHLKITALK